MVPGRKWYAGLNLRVSSVRQANLGGYFKIINRYRLNLKLPALNLCTGRILNRTRVSAADGRRGDIDLNVLVVAVIQRRVHTEAPLKPVGAQPNFIGPYRFRIVLGELILSSRSTIEATHFISARGRYVRH